MRVLLPLGGGPRLYGQGVDCPASSSDSAAWTSLCLCRGLSPSKRELTTATRKWVSLPGGTAWPPLSLRAAPALRGSGPAPTSCEWQPRLPMTPDPALPRDIQMRLAMENRRKTSCPLSIGYGRDKDGSSEGQARSWYQRLNHPCPRLRPTSTLGARLDTRQSDARHRPFPLCDVGGLWPPPRAAERARASKGIRKE